MAREPFIYHNRRRWYILILGSVAYLCMHSFVWAALATVAFDLIVNVLCWYLAGARISATTAGAIVDIFVRIATIVGGLAINAFTAYIFDLTYLLGLRWLFLALIALLYLYIRVLDCINRIAAIYIDYFFVVAALAALTLLMNFVTFGEPYTYLAEMVFIVSVLFLVVISDLPHMQWWSLAIFVAFWIVALVVGYVVNKEVEHHTRYPLSYYFKV